MKFRNFFQELNKRKVDYFIWKSRENTKKFFSGEKDLDIYLNPKHEEIFNKILKKYPHEERISGFDHIRMVYFLEGGKKYLLHIFKKLSFGKSRFTKNYFIERKNLRVISKNSLKYLSPEDEIRIYFLKSIIKKQPKKEAYKTFLNILRSIKGVDIKTRPIIIKVSNPFPQILKLFIRKIKKFKI